MTAETLNQRKLRQAIEDAFDESELRTLCFDLKIDYEALPPGSKVDKARELVALCLREQRIDELISLCEEKRPRVNWRGMMATAVSDEEPPFMGLKYFDADHADLFFGRETITAELTDHLQQNNFLAVVGASGSGKSSLVRAGLVPALQNAQPNAKIHIFTPTDHPLEALATTLTRHTDSVGVTAKFIDAMASDPRSLHLAARRLVNEGEQLLLLIDQFEELFTLCRSENERRAFMDNLVTAVSNLNGETSNRPTRAVIALRADFYHHCAQYDALRRLLETQQRYIGAMNPAELRRAIEQPAQQNGLTFEDGLVDLLLRDVGATGEQTPEPGALPLLSHALLETWRRRESKTLTFSGYSDAGGVQGAIAKTAESVYAQKLTPAQQNIARSIFLRLTELGEGTQDTRRRALISELLPTNAAAVETQTVLNLLSAARLVTTDEETAEVAHEALIREWPTLRRWLDENRDGLRLHRHLTESAQAWQQLNRDSGELYRGARLEQAQEWAAQHNDELNDLEREFLVASVHAVEHRARSERLTQILGISALVIILVGAVVASIVFSRQAEDNRELAETAVAGQSTAVAAGELALESTSDALAAATVNAQATVDVGANATREFLADATATAVLLNQDEDADSLTLIQEEELGTDPTIPDTDMDGLLDGVEVALGTDPNHIDTDRDLLIDGIDNEPFRPFILAPFGIPDEPGTFELEQVFVLDNIFIADEDRLPLYGLSMSPDNARIAASSFAAGTNTTIYLWGTDGSMLTPYDTGMEAPVWDTAFSENRIFAAVGPEIQALDLSAPDVGWNSVPGGGYGNNNLYSVDISADATYILFGGQAVWDFRQIVGREVRSIKRESQNEDTNVQNFVSYFSYDGNFFGRVRDDGSVFLGETFERGFARPFNKSADGAYDMGVTSDGNILMVGYENGRVELYDYSDGRGGPPLIHGLDAHPSFARAVFSPDDTIIATSSPEDSVVRLWRTDDGAPLLELDAEADGVTSLIFSQDGHYLLFGTTAGEVHVYGMPEVER
ncbi:hypothetical protein [Candidatus Leptofilum sp.]|uniref:nSTAND1 domain-containing NTPase n=1 Tax=Candidatus Leptofilum sp. TaxID=3241576 RepID=UPI003B5C989F